MNPNVKPSDRVALIGVINPGSQGAGSVSTGWIAAQDFFSFVADIFAGTLGAAATLDGKLEQAQDGAGTGVKDIANKAITQLTKAGADDDKQARINLRPEELDLPNNFTHFRLTLTVGVAASDIAAAVYGLDGRYEPATDLASVDEIVG